MKRRDNGIIEILRTTSYILHFQCATVVATVRRTKFATTPPVITGDRREQQVSSRQVGADDNKIVSYATCISFCLKSEYKLDRRSLLRQVHAGDNKIQSNRAGAGSYNSQRKTSQRSWQQE